MKRMLSLLLILLLTAAMPVAMAAPEATTPPNEDGMPYLLDNWDNAPAALADWKGTPTYLNFFTTWCGYCKAEMQDLKSLQETYGDNLRVVLVHIPDGENEAAAQAYLKKEKLDTLAFVEDNGFFAYMYGITGYPMSVIIDADGYLSAYFPYAIDAKTMADAVEKAGAALPVEAADAT